MAGISLIPTVPSVVEIISGRLRNSRSILRELASGWKRDKNPVYNYDLFRSFNERGEIFGFSSCYANFRRMRKKVAGNRTPPYVNTIVALMARPVIRKGGKRSLV